MRPLVDDSLRFLQLSVMHDCTRYTIPYTQFVLTAVCGTLIFHSFHARPTLRVIVKVSVCNISARYHIHRLYCCTNKQQSATQPKRKHKKSLVLLTWNRSRALSFRSMLSIHINAINTFRPDKSKECQAGARITPTFRKREKETWHNSENRAQQVHTSGIASKFLHAFLPVEGGHSFRSRGGGSYHKEMYYE